MKHEWRWWLEPLRRRTVLVALATLVGAWAAHVGWSIDDETILVVLTMVVALLFGDKANEERKRRNGRS